MAAIMKLMKLSKLSGASLRRSQWRMRRKSAQKVSSTGALSTMLCSMCGS